MSAIVKGDLTSLREFSKRLAELPRTVGIKIAASAAPLLTQVARTTFGAGEDAFGIAWLPSAEGKRVSLVKSGGLEAGIYYVAIGTKIRVKLSVPYAKYQIGRRPVFPRQGDPLPPAYVRVLTDTTNEVIKTDLGVAA